VIGLEKGLLVLTEIESSSDYESEKETSTSSTLLFYTSSSPTQSPQPPLPIDSPSHYNIMSQHNINQLLLQIR